MAAGMRFKENRMNRSRLLMIGVVALALGSVASLLVYRKLQPGGANSDPGVQVIVAADDLQVGARIEERDIRVISIASADLPPGAPRKRNEVIGHGVIVPISKGEFILPNRLAGENAGSGLPSLIPPGFRAVSVRVNEVVSVAGFVTPGTRVDVLLTGTPGGGNEQETTTVLQNVQVLASGHTLERTATGEAQNTAVITLLVTPDDAERLTLAGMQGHIQLALRNPLDTKQDDVPAANSRGLYKGAAAPVQVRSAPHPIRPVTVAPIPAASRGVEIEVYEGDKKDKVTLPDQSSESQ
jgi:pilus assembly protein CpaB